MASRQHASNGAPPSCSRWQPLCKPLSLLALAAAHCAMGQECPRRNCLPSDATQTPPICYMKTAATTQRPGAQSFATCPSETPHCAFCSTSPPCESRCQDKAHVNRPLGAECYFDEECDGTFARCLQRICRRALLTHQACNASNLNDVCITGQKSCFRGRCQGLSSGTPCNAHSEGADIECSPGWHCYLGTCTPQFPAGHQCQGQHPEECISGYRCNRAAEVQNCIQEYSLSVGTASSDARLCMTNHVNPQEMTCAELPPIEMRYGNKVVEGRDCSQDADCPRTDTSLGQCMCKRWWEGDGQSGFCELSVADPGRPAFKRFWEASSRLCHHDWTQERCAYEIGMEDVLKEMKGEREAQSVDPSQVKDCAKLLMPETVRDIGSPRDKVRWAVSCLPLLWFLAL